MMTSSMYRAEQAWTLTRENLFRVCSDLDLEWYYDPIQYRISFRRRGIDNTMLRDLEECFGDPDNLEFVAAKEVLVRMAYEDIRTMLEWWIKGRSVM